MAACDDDCRREEPHRQFGQYFHDFRYSEDQKTLEIRYVRKDKTVCGVRWDMRKLAPKDQKLWSLVREGMRKSFFDSKPCVNSMDMQEELEEMKKLVLLKDPSVHTIDGVDALKVEHLEEIISAQIAAKPWALAFTAEALSRNTPGTLSIAVVGARSCVLREPLSDAEINQKLQEEFAAMRKDTVNFSHRMQQFFDKMDTAVQELEPRLTRLEELHQEMLENVQQICGCQLSVKMA